MFGVRTAVVSLVLLVTVDGFRTRRKTRRDSTKTVEPEIDPEEDQGNNSNLINETRRERNESLPTLVLKPGDFPKCHLSESDCNIDSMTTATLVYTDSEDSKCFNGEPFAFLVKPGRRDKLLYYFPNGGACWENPFALPGGMTICLPTLTLGLTVTGLGMGVTDYDRSDNVLRDYTFVSAPYCDGGVHVANNTYKGVTGDFYQHGYNNNLFAVNWALQNMDKSLKNFVMGGSSAGSLGTMAWSNYLLSNFRYEKATVIVDSYLGVFPEGTQGPTLKNFGICNLPIWAGFEDACEAGTSNIQDVFDHTMASHPRVAFAVIQPKYDLVQRVFYGAIALSYLKLDLYSSTTSFYKRTNQMLQRYGRHPNFVNYYVDGGFHTFLWFGAYYSATVSGATGLLGKDGKPSLSEWTNALVEHEPVKSQCKGGLENNGGNRLIFKNTKYCDKKLFPKTLFKPFVQCPSYCSVCILSACDGCCN